MAHLRLVAVPPCPDSQLTGDTLPLDDLRALYARYEPRMYFTLIWDYQRRLEVDN